MVRVRVCRPAVGLFLKCKSRSKLLGDSDGSGGRWGCNANVWNFLVFTLNNAGRRIE